MDESLIQDFLTESGELVEQLDSDLLALEDADDQCDLLNSIFRALHTIKGAASFLNLPEVTAFAHVAEFALDKLRKGETEVSEHVVDCLLRSVDVIRLQMGQLETGEAPNAGPDDLVAQLEAIAAGVAEANAEADAAIAGGAAPGAMTDETAAEDADDGPTDSANPPAPYGGIARQLELSPEKRDVLPFMVDDLRESAAKLSEAVEGLAGGESERRASAEAAADVCESVEATAEYYDLEFLKEFVGLLARVMVAAPGMADDAIAEAALRLRAGQTIMLTMADGLRDALAYEWPIETFAERTERLVDGKANSGEVNDPEALLIAEAVWMARDTDGATTPTEQSAAPASDPASPPQGAGDREASGRADPTVEPTADDAPSPSTGDAKRVEPKADSRGAAEQTIRVEVGRLESLLNLVGEMTLTKNQVLGVTRELSGHDVSQEFVEKVTTISSDLDRLTAELQVGVMRTRMQPLDKLFGRYPRIVRDLAKKTGKKVNLEIVGGDTEVDKSVLELLGDPLVHMLRNSVDHGLETPEDREASGKQATGTLVLAAEHQGGHVRIVIEDDGKGIDRKRIGPKAVERGLVSEDALAAMSDEDVFQFIFAAGFSTADQVSDLSGRGVGMDVVRTNINELNGSVRVRSTLGQGTSVEILIPLTVAIMPAMMVGIGDADYAVPLSSIEEIVRYIEGDAETVAGQPVMRLRERVLPLVDMRTTLECESTDCADGFTVIVSVGQERAGLIVDRLIGQQEVVIKPLGDDYTTGGPFSGATIRENGDVSLILDVVKLLRSCETQERPAASAA
jgi:two-component system chemotaxis sensor kinase CheA